MSNPFRDVEITSATVVKGGPCGNGKKRKVINVPPNHFDFGDNVKIIGEEDFYRIKGKYEQISRELRCLKGRGY